MSESKEAERQRFFELVDKFQTSSNEAEQSRIKEELTCMTFGE
jgi:hypothetical protein